MNVDVQPAAGNDGGRSRPIGQLFDEGSGRAALPYPVKGDGRQRGFVLKKDQVERAEVDLGKRVVIGGRQHQLGDLGQIGDSGKTFSRFFSENRRLFFVRRDEVRMVADLSKGVNNVGDGDGVAFLEGETSVGSGKIVVVQLSLSRKHR